MEIEVFVGNIIEQGSSDKINRERRVDSTQRTEVTHMLFRVFLVKNLSLSKLMFP